MGVPAMCVPGPVCAHWLHSRLLHWLARLPRASSTKARRPCTPAMPWSSGGREADAWSYREFMLKPWQELVTHRLMLKPPASFDGADGGGQPHPHLARWQEPPEAAVMRFGVSQAGLVLA